MVDKTQVGLGILENLKAGDFASIVGQFDEGMKQALPAETLKTQWEDLHSNLGGLKGVESIKTGQADGHDLVGMLLDFDKEKVVFSLSFDGDKIAGMHFRPPVSSSPPAAAH